MTVRTGTAVLLTAALAAFAAAVLPLEAAGSDAVGGALLDDALRAMALTREDLSFRTDYADHPDSFRVSVVDSLLLRPLDTEPYVRALAGRLAECPTLGDLVAACGAELDLAALDAAADPAHDAPDRRVESSPVETLLSGLRRSAALIERAFANLTSEERAFIADHAAVLLEEEEFDPDKPIDVRDREAERDEELGDELLRVAGLVDYESLAAAGAVLCSAVDEALLALDSWDGPFEGRPADAPGPGGSGPWSGDVALVLETDVGTVVLGGPGTTVYGEGCAVIIDRGGDDVYRGTVGGARPDAPGAVVIDMDGNDTYLTDGHSVGAGFMGAGVLVDLDGDDYYASGSFSQGSGLFGVGVLRDLAGNDRYAADTCTQGSGAFGIGVLRDDDGNDAYESALFSQAFGFVEGFGALLDAGGNDLYFAGGKYTDEIRYFDHYLSLSQGFGFGWRPDASGGIGLLADLRGNDVYVSDIFGQGSSYWFAVGGLVDVEGNDQYVSYQYAQGAGTHITVAALVDMDGDDNYVSKGVSQGCGHDLAIGILHDLAGDDNYTCHDLSQGAGNANGIGYLLDDSGDDAYSVRGLANTHGYGNYRRDYGSVGIFIDGGGMDSYSGAGADGDWWIGSDHGAGIDAEPAEVLSEADPPQAPAQKAPAPTTQPAQSEPGQPEADAAPAAADTTDLAGMSPEELFLRASSSALQFEHLRAPSRRLLVKNREESIPYLVTQLDTDSPRERLALEDVLVKVGDASVVPLIEAMAIELEREDTSRGARLASSILGRLGDVRAVDALVAAAEHADWKVRASVASAIGRVGALEPVPQLTELLDDENEVVRKSAAVALSRIADAGDGELGSEAVDRLAEALGDPDYSVRYGAARALASAGGEAEDALEMVARQAPEASRLMAVHALGEIGSSGARDVLRSLVESDSWAVRAHAALALGRAEPGRSDRRKLEALLADPHPLPAFAAEEALGDSD